MVKKLLSWRESKISSMWGAVQRMGMIRSFENTIVDTEAGSYIPLSDDHNGEGSGAVRRSGDSGLQDLLDLLLDDEVVETCGEGCDKRTSCPSAETRAGPEVGCL